jgi:energy-coupling factor transport system ATP-binding protein
LRVLVFVMMDTEARIVIQNLSFKYAAARENALSDVCLTVRAGEFVSILGENGSGKSTLLSCVNGLCTPPPGTVTVYDRDGRAWDPANEAHLDPIRRIAGTVLQNADNQIVAPVVEEDCAFGPENIGLPPDIVASRVSTALRQTGIEALRGRSTRFLSGGEKQRLAIAGVLALGGDILLLDECTAMIDPAGRERFYALVAELRRSGCTIIQITHSPEDAARSARCVVLDKGVVVYDGVYTPPAREAAPHSPAGPPPHDTVPAAPGSIPVSFDQVSHTYFAGTAHERRALDNVSLKIAQKETIALIGETGCGKSTLLKHINALLLPESGTVSVFGEDTLNRKTSLVKLRRRVSLALQSPETALFESYVADDVAWGARNLGLKGQALVDRVRWAMDAVGLPFEKFANRETAALSGGEARLAALAGVFVLDGDIVLLDEPTAGLDAGHSERVVKLLEELRARGKTIVVSTHAPDFAARFDRVETIVGGRLAASPAPPEDNGNQGAKPAKNFRRKTGLESFRGLSFADFPAGDSPLRRISAAVKLAATLALLLIIAVLPGMVCPSVLLALLLVLGKAGGNIGPGRLFRGILPIVPVLALFTLIRLVFAWDGDTSRILFRIGIVSVTVYEARETGVMLARLFTMLTALLLYSSVTPSRETLGMVKAFFASRARKPPSGTQPDSTRQTGNTIARDGSLALSIALRFVPILADEAEHIIASQISRGAKTTGLAKLASIRMMIVPLFLRSLERARIIAQAMLLRLYH